MAKYNGYDLTTNETITVEAKDIYIALIRIRDKINMNLPYNIFSSDYATFNYPNGTKAFLILKEES